jgi:hypothetical protein
MKKNFNSEDAEFKNREDTEAFMKRTLCSLCPSSVTSVLRYFLGGRLHEAGK